MTKTAIRVEHLGKRYRIGQREPYRTFRDSITNIAVPLWRLMQRSNSSNGNEVFWALKDVSFEVERGEIVGIIGRNGAGKSTLLKILSRITTPTTGLVHLNGRLSSLLEVGTGFHPELTGRENIYLSGSIMGMRRRDIDENFDEIVKFAEVEKFLDTPAKRYSSGMYVRLAFAVAAHLEPEILLVDEVLAVGDADFQKKCLGKMKDVSREGRTVLFVSHNMNAVERLCESCIVLKCGQIETHGDNVGDIIKNYLFGTQDDIKSPEWINSDDQLNNPWFKPLHVYIGDETGNIIAMPSKNDSEMWIYIEAKIDEIDPSLTFGYTIYNEDGSLLYWSYQTDDCEDQWVKLHKGVNTLRSKIPSRLLNEGIYRLECVSSLHCRQWLCKPSNNAPSIFLFIKGGLSDSPYWMGKREGILAPIMKYELLDRQKPYSRRRQ